MRVVQVVVDYIVYHYCLRFDLLFYLPLLFKVYRGVVHVVVVILSIITV